MTKLVNRAKMTTATTGTGTITLGSAVDGYQTFADAGVVNSDVVRYVIEDGVNWEIGSGTYTAVGTTLSRTVSESSNAGAAINLSGSAIVYVSATAEDIPSLELYAENPGTFIAPTATGENGIAIGSNTIAGTTFSHKNTVAVGNSTTSSQRIRAENTHAVAIGTSYYGSVNASGDGSLAIGTGGTSASASGASAFGAYAQAAAAQAVALGQSRAGGTDSFAAAIANNTSSYGATGANSVAIGYQVKASGQRSAVVGGYASTASNSYSAVYNSGASVASGYGATVIGGLYNDAIGQYSFALGYGAQAKEIGKFARSATIFSGTASQAQSGEMILSAVTSDATATPMTANWSTASTDNQIILPNNSAYAFHGTIVARQQASAGTACAAWKIEGLIRREGSAGTTLLVNSATTVIDNTPAWGMALSADTTNGGLAITVTGAAATNIRWVATIHTSEVTY